MVKINKNTTVGWLALSETVKTILMDNTTISKKKLLTLLCEKLQNTKYTGEDFQKTFDILCEDSAIVNLESFETFRKVFKNEYHVDTTKGLLIATKVRNGERKNGIDIIPEDTKGDTDEFKPIKIVKEKADDVKEDQPTESTKHKPKFDMSDLLYLGARFRRGLGLPSYSLR